MYFTVCIKVQLSYYYYLCFITTGDVVQLAGDVRRLQLLSSTNASTSDTFLSPHYLSSNEKLSSESETFLTPPAVRSAVSDVKSSQRSHRRSVSSVPFRLRNTPKLLQNSLILQSLSPEQWFVGQNI